MHRLLQTLSLIILIFSLVPATNSDGFTPSNTSVTPRYAKSQSSAYSFTLNSITTFSQDMNIHIVFPIQYTLTTPTNCGFWVNGAQKTSAQCSVNLNTNEIMFNNLSITESISNIQIQFNTATARYAGSSTLTFNYYNASTNTIMNTMTNYVSITIINAVMSCSISSTSDTVGNSVNYTISYTPLVNIEADTILQINMRPWGAYSQSNFLTSNTSQICAGACSLNIPSTNGNVSQILRYTSLFPSEVATQGSITLNQARNPPSTQPISVSVILLAKVSQFTESSYMNCTSSFSVSTLNQFQMIDFSTTNKSILASNVVTLRLQITNPISPSSYIRIDSGILGLSYQYNLYNQGTRPSEQATADGTMLLGNLTASTSVSPNILSLNNFILSNPPYSTKPVTLTFTTQNLVGSTTYYQIDRSTVSIIANPSTIISAGLTINDTSINSNTKYNLWFKTINRLISTSFIVVTLPNEVRIVNSTCSLIGIASSCLIINSTSVNISIDTIVAADTNISLNINNVINPPTTTTTATALIFTYYQDSLSLVDQLISGTLLSITATPVPLKSASLSALSYTVGALTTYSLQIQISNNLPASSTMKIKIPTASFTTTNVVLQKFQIGSVVNTNCTITTLSPMYIQLNPNCFPTSTPATTYITANLSNITNPYSTKPTQSWQVQTLFNSKQMEYLMSGITVTMATPSSLTSFTVTPASTTANQVNTYQFQFNFQYPHYSFDRVILEFPDGIILGAGFQCTPITSGIAISCFSTSSITLEITFNFSANPTINSLKFNVTSITNNWYASTRTFNAKTTTNDTSYYYVESGSYTVNYQSASLTATAASNQLIILLGESTIKITITSPFVLNRANQSKLYLTMAVPTDLTPIANSCQISYSGGSCLLPNGQLYNITGFLDFASPIVVTFRANTSYFVNTNVFTIILMYDTSVVANSLTLRVSSYCTTPCKQCSAIKTYCITCLSEPQTSNSTYLPDNNTCVVSCPVSYYQTRNTTNNISTCFKCNQTACKQCETSANTCTSCNTNKYLYDQKCLSVCPTFYYPLNGQCIACSIPCSTCTSAATCLTCINNYFLDLNSKCVLTCSNISYLGINGTCQLCTNNCLTCAVSLSNCTSCEQSQYLLLNNACVRACPSGFYNNINSTCEKCKQPCATCASATICQSCIATYYLYKNATCTRSCPDGTIPVINTCATCSPECATCSLTLSNCTSCPSSLLFYLNQCLGQCPPLTYPYNKTCTTCIVPCLTCLNSPELCLSCVNDLLILNATCVKACPNNGYYQQGKQCLMCSDNCLYCSSLATCTLCKQSYYLLNGACTSSCPSSNPIVGPNRKCTACSPQCSSCKGTVDNCTACTIYYFQYLYTCVETCPLTYYSNQATYKCESGLTTKIVFFPILITGIVVAAVALLSKCIAPSTSVVTALTALFSPLEIAIWVYVMVLLGQPIKQPDINYVLPTVMIGIALLVSFVAGVAFYFLNKKRMEKDEDAVRWASSNVNFTVCRIIQVLAIPFGCKFFRLSYSRLFNSIPLSLAFKYRENVFTLATIFTIIVLVFCQILAIVGCYSLVYSKTLKDQMFYSAIQGLIVTVAAALFSLIDIYKSQNFFEDSEFCKMKKYVQRVKDSSFNKLEEGFDIEQEEGSVDAQRFVSTTGGKFLYTKQNPDSFKDYYFQQNSENNEDRTIATDVLESRQNKKQRFINIFAPIKEEDAEYYETEKYEIEEVHTELELESKKKKMKSIASDEEGDLTQKYERKAELGADDVFDDKISLMGERDRKKRWNDIMSKRKELAERIFNRHPIELAKIQQPMGEDDDIDFDNLNGDRDQGNLRRRRRKKKGKHNKELEEIYLQRLTEKKKKSARDTFVSEKFMKYDF